MASDIHKTLCLTCLLAIMLPATLRSQNTNSTQTRKDTWFNRLIYGNRDRTFEKKFDASFLPAPTWSMESSFGIGGILTGLYRLDKTDSVMPPSDISLGGNISISGFYAVAAFGNNYFRGNRFRLSYKMTFANKPLDLWGITYEDCLRNPPIRYTRRTVLLETDWVYKLTRTFHAGASLDITYMGYSDISHTAYLQGQKSSYFFTGIGLSLIYDTRDYIQNPRRGIYFRIKESIMPRSFSNHNRTLFSTNVNFNAYQKVWKGGWLAFDLYGKLNGEGTPWVLRERTGSGTSRMRGYYEGRFTDCSQLSAQLEWRQRIYKRLGTVAWGGGGLCFPTVRKLKISQILPNFGLGLRFEFKHNLNLRVDYGFGRDSRGLVFGFGEAF